MLLMIPTSIEILHELENHKHAVCTSIGEQHLHEQDLDCDDFHKQLTVFSAKIVSNLDVIPTHYYTSVFIDKAQFLLEVYKTKKYSRGPPNFIV